MTICFLFLALLAADIDAFLGRWNMSVKMGDSEYLCLSQILPRRTISLDTDLR